MNKLVFSAFFSSFSRLKPIQKQSIPLILEGKNVVVSAGTGTGKTEAVLAPLISLYWVVALSKDTITWLYVVPTKALANDIYRRINSKLDTLSIRVGIRHGDKDDTRKKKQPHILITTPESFDVILSRKDGSLKNIRALIIDEAHLLYNTQRGLHTSLLIARLKNELIDPSLQIVCLSATISLPEELVKFLIGSEEDFYNVSDSTYREIDAAIEIFSSYEDFVNLIKKIFDTGPYKLLTFIDSRKQCDILSSILSQNELAPYVFTHYSSLSPEIREETEKKFNQSKQAICIATSTLELGIDIGDIDAIILFNPPITVSSFLQRIGRGNRKKNKTNVICIVNQHTKNEIFDSLTYCALIELAQEGIMEETRPMRLYGAMVQQALSIIASKGGAYTRVKDIASLSSNHEHLTEEVIDDIYSFISSKGYTKPHDYKHRYGADDKLWELVDYRAIYGNFPQNAQKIVIYQGDKELGSVPITNLFGLKRGQIIRFAGKCWRVLKFNKTKISVEVSHQVKDATSILYFSDEFDATNVLILNKIYEYAAGKAIDLSVFNQDTKKKISDVLSLSSTVFSNYVIPIIIKDSTYYHITFAGNLCNNAICIDLGIPASRVDNLGIYSSEIIDFSKINTNLNEYLPHVENLFSESKTQTIFQSLLPRKLQILEFVEEWRCNKEIEKTLKRLNDSKTMKVPRESISWLLEGD